MTESAKSPLAIRIVFSVLMVFISFIAGAMIGSLFVTKEDGLAGGATVFLGGVFGMATALVAAIMLYRSLAHTQLKTALLIAGGASVVITILLVYSIINRQAAVGEDLHNLRPSGIAHQPGVDNSVQTG
ncbi:MAG: hypothetical protein ACKVRP_12015 [Bacteroidota bacterium]